MPYYSWFSGHGRAVLADDLGAEDPFGLAPDEIVDRVIAAGHMPAVDRPQSEPFLSLGVVTKVDRKGLVYLVAVHRAAEEIGVQERRDKAYDPVE